MNYKVTSKILPLLLLLLSSWAQAGNNYSQVYVFGDSLSDTGNLASVIGDFPYPYYQNRVTNGPVGVEVLAAKLGHTLEASLYLLGVNAGSNYAVAGANAVGTEPIDLLYQVGAFQANHGQVAPDDALYVIFIGGNDIRTARDATNRADAESAVDEAAKAVSAAIESLAQSGAKSFLLINAPNIGAIPETRLIAAATANPELIEQARKASKRYRKALDKLAKGYRKQDDIQIIEFDLYKFFNKFLDNAEDLGFINSSDACFSSATASFHADCGFPPDFDSFVFFDEIHPTARVHALVGEAMYQQLTQKH